MSIDVLEINRLRTISANNGSAVASINTGLFQRAKSNYFNGCCWWSCWDSIFPQAPTSGTTFCVGCMRVGTDTYLRCGAACSWTVPAGVQVAKFEVWGAGAGTLPGCCCSIQPFGVTGAYATICMPVTPGQVFTLCAGCASCCYACNTMTLAVSCPSYVANSTGVIHAFASGGVACFPWMIIMQNSGYFGKMTQCFAAYKIPSFERYFGGSCCGYASCAIGIPICSYGESCLTSAKCTHDIFPVTPVTGNPWQTANGYCGYVALANGEIRKAVGVPSLTSEICLTSGTGCGYIKHPPIVGFANTSQCCVSWSTTQATFGGYLCSPLQGNNYLTAPGSGGNMVYTAGGCNNNCGDAGRGGMVRVTYC